jgi:GTPase SAR1 family protein
MSVTFQDLNTTFSRSLKEFRSATAGIEQEKLLERWEKILNEGAKLNEHISTHRFAQAPKALEALAELAYYTDPFQPFRLSVIGVTGVGKSTLINALLGGEYSPSGPSGGAKTATRIRFRSWELADEAHRDYAWKVVFLKPRNLWDLGHELLKKARQGITKPESLIFQPPNNQDSREEVLSTLHRALQDLEKSELGSDTMARTAYLTAKDTLNEMLKVFEQRAIDIPDSYELWIKESDFEKEVRPYIEKAPEHAQAAEKIYLAVDYVERYLAPKELEKSNSEKPDELSLLKGRRVELEDVLGLNDLRDSYFASDAFKHAFAVIIVVGQDRGLGDKSLQLLNALNGDDKAYNYTSFSRSDVEKAIVVINKFEDALNNLDRRNGLGNLKGIADVWSYMDDQPNKKNTPRIPLFLSGALIANEARHALSHSGNNRSLVAASDAKPTYTNYLRQLIMLVEIIGGNNPPEYLRNFLGDKQMGLLQQSKDRVQKLSEEERATLSLELSGLPILSEKINQKLSSSAVLESRVNQARIAYDRAVSEVAAFYAGYMHRCGLTISSLERPTDSSSHNQVRFESRNKNTLREIYNDFHAKCRKQLTEKSLQRPWLPELQSTLKTAREELTETVARAMQSPRLVIVDAPLDQLEFNTDYSSISYHYINSWLTKESSSLKRVAGPLKRNIEQLVSELKHQLITGEIGATTDGQYSGWHSKLNNDLSDLLGRLDQHAETLAMQAYYQNRVILQGNGEELKDKEEHIKRMQDSINKWFGEFWYSFGQVALTEVYIFVDRLGFEILGLRAHGSIVVELEMALNGRKDDPEVAPVGSLLRNLLSRYQNEEEYRLQQDGQVLNEELELESEIQEWRQKVEPFANALQELKIKYNGFHAFHTSHPAAEVSILLSSIESNGNVNSTK